MYHRRAKRLGRKFWGASFIGQITLGMALLIQSAQVLSDSEALNSLASLEWNYRVILLSGSEADQRALERAQLSIDERHTVWFLMMEDGVRTNFSKSPSNRFTEALIERYLKKPVKAVLLGKDGGLKVRQNVFDLDALLMAIDAMPMRQQEMRQREIHYPKLNKENASHD